MNKVEKWKKDSIIKQLEQFEDRDWYYNFVDNDIFSLPVTRFYLLNNGWKKIDIEGHLPLNLKRDLNE